MRRTLINEDSNQFGPGTDLIICLLALLIIFVIIVSYLYKNEKESFDLEKDNIAKWRLSVENLQKENEKLNQRITDLKIKGTFEHGGEFLVAGTFLPNPYYALKDPQATESQVSEIVRKYRSMSNKFPYIFVIGHASEAGLEDKPDLSYEERLRYNWEFAGVRSAVIANLIQKQLSEEEKDKIVIVSTGEFDLKIQEDPESSENAFVEVFFGNEWKPQSYKKPPLALSTSE